MSSENSPQVTVSYVSARNGDGQDRSGPLKESGDDYLLIDTGEVNQPNFNTKRDTRVLLKNGEVETVTPNKTEHLGEVSKVTIIYKE
jgi:hypothetical protein